MNRPTSGELEAKGKEVLDAYLAALYGDRNLRVTGMQMDFYGYLEDPALVYAEYGGLIDWFTRLGENDPGRLETMVESIRHTTTSLEDPDLENINGVRDTVQSWQGPAADAFYENFAMPFPQIHRNHRELSIELETALTAAIQIIDNSRRDAMAVGDNAIEMLKNMESSGGGGGGGLSLGLTIVGAVAGVAGTIATGGTATIVWALIGASAGVASAAVSPEATISGASPEEALASVTGALSQIHTAVEEEEAILAEALRSDLAAISKDDMFLPYPVILSNPRNRIDDFRLPAGVEN